MSRIFVHGIGAVSPAGWTVADLCGALEKNIPLPFQNVARPGREKALRERIVPPPASRPAFFAHPRLRRATAIAQHSVAAALEALAAASFRRAEFHDAQIQSSLPRIAESHDAPSRSDLAQIQSGALRLGIITGVLSGCVNYSRRFYEEVLREPATASPLIFPETVFNAPASHLGAYLATNAINYTLVGDNGAFLQGLALAAQWLEADKIDACLVVGMDEADWITADAIKLFHKDIIHGAGAGVLYLKKEPANAMAELSAVTDSFSFTYQQNRAEAAKKMRAELPSAGKDELLCDSTSGIPAFDAAENLAWQDWRGPRRAPKTILGEAFVASAAWQCVAACDALARGNFPAAQVSVVGVNQQAIGARFIKPS